MQTDSKIEEEELLKELDDPDLLRQITNDRASKEKSLVTDDIEMLSFNDGVSSHSTPFKNRSKKLELLPITRKSSSGIKLVRVASPLPRSAVKARKVGGVRQKIPEPDYRQLALTNRSIKERVAKIKAIKNLKTGKASKRAEKQLKKWKPYDKNVYKSKN